jgi:signal transduction histidine kinase
MKKMYLFTPLLFFFLFSRTQSNIDSLLQAAYKAPADSSRVYTLARIAAALMFSSPDSSLQYANDALALAHSIDFKKGEAQSLSIIANNYSIKGNYTLCFENHIKALRIYEEIDFLPGVGNTYNNLALIYDDQGDYPKALQNYLKAKDVFDQLRIKDKLLFDQRNLNNNVVIILNNIGNDYEKINKLDSALFYQNKAFALASAIKENGITGTILTNLGNVHYKLMKADAALQYYRTGIPYLTEADDKQTLAEAYLGIAKILERNGQKDSSLFYSKQSYSLANESSYLKGEERAALLLSALYEDYRQADSALKYFKISSSINDSISSTEVIRQLHLMNFNEQILQQEKKAAEQQYRSNLKMYALAGGLFILLMIASFLYRNNRIKQKANILLQRQKIETEIQSSKAENALVDLKATQSQLVQREKMASLGELTAGIAHEIQNPLNFVNNFSEVSVEIMDEIKTELTAGNKEEAIMMADEIKENLKKIVLHGKRADAIVKGMLQHSRGGAGQKEATNINAITDEYLRLSYHGMRVKDNTFSASIQTKFDAALVPLNIIPQDIGKVLLNLFNNSFYALKEKKKMQDNTYEPKITVCTKKVGNTAVISVKDNGTGIPNKIIDKIYQPFFTTKPTGEGTGLGLSLSYDIITKGHGGDLKVASKEGEFTEFEIMLPQTN